MTDLKGDRADHGSDASTRTADPDRVVRRRRWMVAEPLGHVEPLDGLRSVAVTGVLLYHARFPWISGGFLGVSTFFTLSGFLITSLLLREWNSSDGAVDLHRFWRRRFRRLLPASWTTIGLVLVMGLVGVWNNDQLRSLRGDVPYALAEIINWHFIAQDRSYGADFQAPSPLEHFWSLAVEQQFYVVLPLLVVGALALGRSWPPRRRVGTLVGVLGVLTVFSAVSNGYWAGDSIDRAYFGTDTRMAEMLVGSLLACATLRRLRLPDGVLRWAAMAAGAVAAVVTLWMWHVAELGSGWLYPWGLLLSATCTAALVFSAIQGGALGWFLSLPPLLWLGRISYGVYLLHWPIFLWLTPARTGWSPWPLFALRMVVTCLLAVGMFRLIENPVRRDQRLRGRIAPLTAVGAAIALLAGTFWISRDLPPPSALQTVTDEEAATPTTIAPPPVRVLVIGDQVAASLAGQWSTVPGLEVTVAATPDCGLALGGYVARSDGGIERDAQRCNMAREEWVRAAEASRPDVVLVLGTLRDVQTRRFSLSKEWVGPDDAEVQGFLRGDVAQLADDLGANGAEVVLVTLPPVLNTVPPAPPPDAPVPEDPKAAELQGAEYAEMLEDAPGPVFAENDEARIDQLNTILAEVAAEKGLRLMDLAALTRTWEGGAVAPELRPDGVGFTPEAAAEIGRWFEPQLRDRRNLVQQAAPPPVIAPDTPLPEAPPERPRTVVSPGASADVLVVGDSVSFAIGYALDDWGKRNGELRAPTAAQFGCAVARGGNYKFQRETQTFEQRCDWGVEYPELLNDIRPDVVVLGSGIWEVVDRQLPGDDRFRHVGAPDVDRFILGEFLAAIDTLGSDGAHVVVLTQPHIQSGLDKGETNLPESDPARMDRLNELLAEAVALRPGVATLLDLQGWVAATPGGELDPAIRPDGIHFTDDFADEIARWMGPEVMRIARGG